MEVRDGYKKTEIGVIPEDWEVKKLGEECDVRDGTHDSPKYTNKGVRFVTSKNIVNGKLDFSDISLISELDAKEINKRSKVDKGDILMSMIGTIGNAVLIDVDPNFCIKNTALIKHKKTDLDFNYLIQLIYSEFYQNYINNKLDGGIQKFISLSVLRYLDFPLPPLPEQKAIAEVLSDTDNLIQALEKRIAKKRLIKQGAMQKLLTPKDNWEVEEIIKLASVTTGSKNTQDRTDDGKYPFFVRSQTIERINSYAFDGEAVLTAGDGVGTGKVFHYINGKFDFHQRVYKISHFNERLDGYFFFLYFSNNFYNRIMQMTAKSSVDSVRMEMIANMKIPLPPLPEQKVITEVLSDMDKEIETLEKKRAKYKLIKQGLMQNLLTGKIRLV